MLTHWTKWPSKRSGQFHLSICVSLFLQVFAFCVFPAGMAHAAGSAPLTVWTVATSPTPTGDWYAVDYLNGQWLALGHTSEVAVSSNASTWTEYPVPAGSWQSVAYGDGEYVALSAVAAGDEEMVSTNGTNWASLPGPSGEWTGLIFDQGRFVAVSSLGQIATSTDGQRWTVVWNHRPWDLSSITYGNGHFVAADTAVGSTLISSNGINWSLYPPIGSGLKWSAVVYGNGTFVAFDESGSGYIATSVYGYTWSLHRYSPAQMITGATYGCGSFVASGEATGPANNFLTSTTGATWTATAVPTGTTADWTAVAYGAHRFVAVDNAGDIAWTNSNPDCAATIPSTPQQVSGNVASGQVWTYMHPSAHSGGSPVNSYRVTISGNGVTKECTAPVYFQPNCIVRGLRDHQVYWVTAQAHNRFGFSAFTDPEFVIPVARWTLSAVTSEPVMSQSEPVVVEVTGVIANVQGIYPVSVVTVHFGELVTHCYPNPFGECLITIPNPPLGVASVYASYTGYGRSYTSPIFHVTIAP